MGERCLQADTLSLKDFKGRNSSKPPLGSQLHIGLGFRAEEVKGVDCPSVDTAGFFKYTAVCLGGTVPVPTGLGASLRSAHQPGI